MVASGCAATRADLVPVHQRLAARPLEIDADRAREIAHDGALVLLADVAASDSRADRRWRRISWRGRAVERDAALRPSARTAKSVAATMSSITSHHRSARAVDQRRRDIDRERRAVLLEHRQRFGQVVAIGVVGGDGRELPAVPPGARCARPPRPSKRRRSRGLHVGDQASRKSGAMLRWRLTPFGFSGRRSRGAASGSRRCRRRTAAPAAPGREPGDVERQLPDRLARRRSFIHLLRASVLELWNAQYACAEQI